MNSFRFYEIVNAVSLHFKDGSSYDFFKYGGKTRVNQDSFLGRKDKYFYEKCARKLQDEKEAIEFTAVNFLHENKYIRNFNHDLFVEFSVSYRDALSYKFRCDVEKYSKNHGNVNPIDECFEGSTEAYKYLLILNHITNNRLFLRYDEMYRKNNFIIWDNLKKNLLTYYPFMLYYLELDNDTVKTDLVQIVKTYK